MAEYYFEDGINVRTNSVTIAGGKGVQYDAVLSFKFSDEDNTEPVSLQEAKDYCMVDGNDYDSLINMLIPAAREQVERAKKVSLINRTITAKIKPGTNLPFGPVIEIESIEDDSGNSYDELKDASCDVTVVYAAGYEDGIPKNYKLAILDAIKAKLPTL
jgi:hypothetical protein